VAVQSELRVTTEQPGEPPLTTTDVGGDAASGFAPRDPVAAMATPAAKAAATMTAKTAQRARLIPPPQQVISAKESIAAGL
jgi:hypothetical protein